MYFVKKKSFYRFEIPNFSIKNFSTKNRFFFCCFIKKAEIRSKPGDEGDLADFELFSRY